MVQSVIQPDAYNSYSVWHITGHSNPQNSSPKAVQRTIIAMMSNYPKIYLTGTSLYITTVSNMAISVGCFYVVRQNINLLDLLFFGPFSFEKQSLCAENLRSMLIISMTIIK